MSVLPNPLLLTVPFALSRHPLFEVDLEAAVSDTCINIDKELLVSIGMTDRQL